MIKISDNVTMYEETHKLHGIKSFPVQTNFIRNINVSAMVDSEIFVGFNDTIITYPTEITIITNDSNITIYTDIIEETL